MTASGTRHRLHLLRHAKSSWEDRSLRDHARPLAPRGITAALTMRRHLQHQDFAGAEVAVVLCSTAERTRQTWDGVRAGLPTDPEVRFLDEIYDARPETLLRLVRGLAEEVPATLVIGHNPGVADLAMSLADTALSDDAAVRRLAEKYPTGALATLSFDGPWAGLGAGTARLDTFVRPRDLPS